MLQLIENWLGQQNLDAATALVLTRILAYVFVIFLSVLANLVAKRVILSVVRSLVSRSRTDWDDVLVQRRVFTKLSHLAPALVLYTLMPLALEGYDLLLLFISVRPSSTSSWSEFWSSTLSSTPLMTSMERLRSPGKFPSRAFCRS